MDEPKLPKLPTPVFKKGWTMDGIADANFFESAQMKDYATQAVLLERERAAQFVLSLADVREKAERSLEAIAAAIRG